MKKLKEIYWAVRIGDPRKDTPFLMVNPNDFDTPALYPTQFIARASALRLVGHRTKRKVIRVKITELI